MQKLQGNANLSNLFLFPYILHFIFLIKEFHPPFQTCKEFSKLEIQKQVADGLNEAANLQFNAGRHEEALRLYSQAILKDSSEAKFFGNRCAVLMMLDKYDDAFYDAKKAIELNKNYSKIYDRAIRCCLIIGEIHGAEEIIRTFKNYHPSDPSLDGNVIKFKKLKEMLITATQSYKIGDYKSCMKTIEKCFEISPRYLMMLQLKASCLEATNCLEEALELRDKILTTDPRNADYMRDRGIVLHRLGKLHEALQTLELAARMQPKEDEVIKNRRLHIKMLLEKTSLGEGKKSKNLKFY